MKWLKFEIPEKRNKVLTIRISESSHKQMVKTLEYVKKKVDSNISQADLIERLINEAYNEAFKKKG